jgi:hypothetical protein
MASRASVHFRRLDYMQGYALIASTPYGVIKMRGARKGALYGKKFIA